ncbi:hypothetical protein [Methanimicrococcus hongohii]|uniref:hypothetical protein n=1 Tax=Methanimicrococcus hongohii TaxID=3028295 RepID=UPI00292D3F9B|nr:hypothetical protein [Methanimicrococcus sp. Hf6]
MKRISDVPYGTTPTYDGTDPVRVADAQYTYTFTGWDPAISSVTGDITYKAVFSSVVNNYTVTWTNYDDTVLETDTDVPYGTTPTYDGNDPVRVADAQYTYTFTGWDPAISSVTGDITYKAVFSSVVNNYTVTWTNYDDTVLETDINVPYGTTPTYDGNNPVRVADAQYTYTFTGWDPAISSVTGDITYKAVFSSVVNNYTVTWTNYDDTVLETDTDVPYGTTPTYDGNDPVRPTHAQYTYTFTGWDPAISSVTGDITYKAVFSSVVNNYTVTWTNYDDTVLETDTDVPYGTTPTYDGNNPVRVADAQYTYTFTGWDPAISSVTGDITYKAVFSSVVNNYTVTWTNYDDTVLETDTDVPYGTTPTYDGNNPVRVADAQYTYTFTGWDPAISSVTGDITYKAVFSSVVNNYTVTWTNYDDTVLETDTDVPYGTTPTYDGTDPVRVADAQYTYTFTRIMTIPFLKRIPMFLTAQRRLTY